MIEQGDGAGLAEKPALQVGIVEALGAGDLEGHPTAQGRIERQKNHAMTAASRARAPARICQTPGDSRRATLPRPEGPNPLETLELHGSAEPPPRGPVQPSTHRDRRERPTHRPGRWRQVESRARFRSPAGQARAQIASGSVSSPRSFSTARNQSIRAASGERPRTRPISWNDWLSRSRSSITRR